MATSPHLQRQPVDRFDHKTMRCNALFSASLAARLREAALELLLQPPLRLQTRLQPPIRPLLGPRICSRLHLRGRRSPFGVRRSLVAVRCLLGPTPTIKCARLTYRATPKRPAASARGQSSRRPQCRLLWSALANWKSLAWAELACLASSPSPPPPPTTTTIGVAPKPMINIDSAELVAHARRLLWSAGG